MDITKLFIHGKGTALRVREPNAVINDLLMSPSRAFIELTLEDGKPITVAVKEIRNVVGPLPVKVDGGLMSGRKITIRSADALAREDLDDPSSDGGVVRSMTPDTPDRGRYVCVLGEDLAEALIGIITPDLEEYIWLNPTIPNESADRTLLAVRLLLEAEQLFLDANTPDDVPEKERALEIGDRVEVTRAFVDGEVGLVEVGTRGVVKAIDGYTITVDVGGETFPARSTDLRVLLEVA